MKSALLSLLRNGAAGIMSVFVGRSVSSLLSGEQEIQKEMGNH